MGSGIAAKMALDTAASGNKYLITVGYNMSMTAARATANNCGTQFAYIIRVLFAPYINYSTCFLYRTGCL